MKGESGEKKAKKQKFALTSAFDAPALNHNIAIEAHHLTMNPALDRSKRIASAPAGRAALHNLIVSSSMGSLTSNKHQLHSDPDFPSQKRRRCSLTASGSSTASLLATTGSTANSTFFSPDADAHQSVHTLVPAIVQRCQQAANCGEHKNPAAGSEEPAISPPEEECYLLAYWARLDNYNKAVICSMGGVDAVIRAMRTFPDCAGLQECGCFVLGNLSRDSPCHSRAVARAGGVGQILQSAQRHPGSVAVQSAVCEALQAVLDFDDEQGLEGASATTATSKTRVVTMRQILESSKTDLLHVLSHASSMVLPRNKHRIAQDLLAKTLMHRATTSINNTAAASSSTANKNSYSPAMMRMMESDNLSALLQHSLM